jgi:hypothetical protein
LYKKGLVYEGFKVMPFSTKLGTPLSNFEANLNYREVDDPSLTVIFPLVDEPKTALLTDILIPSKSIAQGYEAYVVETISGGTLDGVLGGQTTTTITLRHEDGKQDIIQRKDINRCTRPTFPPCQPIWTSKSMCSRWRICWNT